MCEKDTNPLMQINREKKKNLYIHIFTYPRIFNFLLECKNHNIDTRVFYQVHS